MADGPTIRRGKSRQDHPTPWEFIRACENRWGPIKFDLAASPTNAKAKAFYSEKDNALLQDWHKIPGICWLNPPFDNIAPWAAKCEFESKLGARILFLTPASIGSNWFAEYVDPVAEVNALNGRITFEGSKDPYPKDCMLSAFGFGQCNFRVWRWNSKDLI